MYLMVIVVIMFYQNVSATHLMEIDGNDYLPKCRCYAPVEIYGNKNYHNVGATHLMEIVGYDYLPKCQCYAPNGDC